MSLASDLVRNLSSSSLNQQQRPTNPSSPFDHGQHPSLLQSNNPRDSFRRHYTSDGLRPSASATNLTSHRATFDSGLTSPTDLAALNSESTPIDPAFDGLHTSRSSVNLTKTEILERKRAEHQQKRLDALRQFERQMQMLEEQQKRDEQELLAAGHAVPGAVGAIGQRTSMSTTGSMSVPATPPQRLRTVGIATTGNSPFGLGVAQLATPPPDHAFPATSRFANSKSMPGTRRNSGDRDFGLEFDDFPVMLNSRLSISNTTLKSSMKGGQQGYGGQGPTRSAGPTNVKFLFEDDDETGSGQKQYLQVNTTDDQFPILVRRESLPGFLSASSAALDLAHPVSQLPGHVLERAHAQAQAQGQQDDWPTAFSARQSRHHSRESSSHGLSPPKPFEQTAAVQNLRPSLAKHASFSTPEVPTLAHFKMNQNQAQMGQRSMPNGVQGSAYTSLPPPRSPLGVDAHAQLATNPAALGRTGASPLPSPSLAALYNQQGGYGFPTVNDGVPGVVQAQVSQVSQVPVQHIPVQSPPFGIGFPGGPLPPQDVRQGPAHFAGPPMGAPSPVHQHRGPGGAHAQQAAAAAAAARKNHDAEASRFAGVLLESLAGEIFSLCKDQHGCRFLQKKLDERSPAYRDMIFNETQAHVVELMTDPFGNYLCQKLIEHCTEDQRTVIVEKVAHELVGISLNMHGTRAIQKMIEYLTTPKQITIVVQALEAHVVTLIRDLNGNHVIQRILSKSTSHRVSRLSSDDVQFIYNAVSSNCVEVASHRHGCCVLQRCIDHASPEQKNQVVRKITENALALVQDQFGNYVVQYVLDLGEPALMDALIRQFLGSIPMLSMQKFSSNVIEKCIRVAEAPTRRLLVEELTDTAALEKLLKDSFGNYVVQTAMDFAEDDQRNILVDAIKPIMPSIRTTTYGKRVQSRMAGGQHPPGYAPRPAFMQNRPPAGFHQGPPPHLQGFQGPPRQGVHPHAQRPPFGGFYQ
ncbi:ARM repeat-containing protein [Saitoella complicata NRRL Y-17804]|uniref:ARM repeat-containing protein n=1 Tax=Saitoella complicata (strain BCRC 22490 / CBS 7301 / JCM 7358 / NBRC 10748 / NRRL Y-17804) TaxID=698492 RepID=UPI000866D2D4|nr:ARM repeat-containing protein [Saitoella complicata NRRL Y-17804]ODQ53123.1 ARM repeat-containing protein [Saitoella complicata NRRL Y-17804]